MSVSNELIVQPLSGKKSKERVDVNGLLKQLAKPLIERTLEYKIPKSHTSFLSSEELLKFEDNDLRSLLSPRLTVLFLMH
jgi:hypothetical protein